MPCARLTMPRTPKISEKPTAESAKTPPRMRPSSSVCTSRVNDIAMHPGRQATGRASSQSGPGPGRHRMDQLCSGNLFRIHDLCLAVDNLPGAGPHGDRIGIAPVCELDPPEGRGKVDRGDCIPHLLRIET